MPCMLHVAMCIACILLYVLVFVMYLVVFSSFAPFANACNEGPKGTIVELR